MIRTPHPRLASAAALAAAAMLLASCAAKDDRCYLDMNRYRELRAVFVETGSMQRVEQLMAEQKWADCEKNQFRYLVEKDLLIDDLIGEQITPASRYEPPQDGPNARPADTPDPAPGPGTYAVPEN